MLQKGLEHNQITVNQMCNIATAPQLDNQKFIHEPVTIVLKKTVALAVKKHLADRTCR